MSDLAVDVTVKTRFATAQALMAVISTGIERGALRLPTKIEAGRTFEIALLTATGEVAVRGTAESVRQDGGTTLVRFLSATEDSRSRDAWIDLDDAVVSVSGLSGARETPRPESRSRARARERSDWSGAVGTPLPPEPARHGVAPAKALVPPLPPGRPARAAAPRPSIPDIPPLESRRSSGALELPELAPLATGSRTSLPPAPPPSVAAAPPPVAPTVQIPPPVPPQVAPPEPQAAPGSTIPPPLMAVFAAPGAGYYMAPAPSWPADAPPDARMRPTTLPPGWGPDQGRMWIPVMDPATMAVPAAAAATPAATAGSGRAARGVLIASVVIATAGAAVAVSAVMWARSVSQQRAAPAVAAAPAPMTAAAPVTARAPVTTPAPVTARAPVTAPAPVTTPAPVAAPVPVTAPAAAAAAGEPTSAPAPRLETAVAAVAVDEPVAEPEPAVVAPPASGAPASCRVAVTTNADRVGIFVDGERRGVTPASIAVPCAPTTVVLRHPRYQEQIRHIEPTADPLALHVLMPRPTAHLRIVTRPSGATVVVDGHTVGRSPLTTTVDGFERAKVTLTAPGMQPEERRVYAKNGTTMVMVTLKKK